MTNSIEKPLLTVDVVLFTIEEDALKILLLKRDRAPFENNWSLPGGIVDVKKDTSAQDTAIRKVTEKTGVTPPYLEQLNTFASQDRDPRGWSASITYFVLMPHEELTDQNTQWINLNELEKHQPLAFDHQEIIQQAQQRLKQKALYSMLPVYCLPKKFTLGAYHKLIEIILEKPIQKKTLYRRFEASNMFEETGETIATGARAAMLYKLKKGVKLVNFERNLG